MTNQALTTTDPAGAIEQALIGGDLKALTSAQRVSYYNRVCESIGVNPLTKPFEYIVLNGKLTLYARKDCTDQLRQKRRVSITKLERERVDDIYLVTAYAQDGEGRTDSSIGAVNTAGLRGDALANAMMKAETKAKRRVTLSICGLGWLDETEVETVVPAESAAAVPHEDAGTPPTVPASEGLYAGEDENGDSLVNYDAATPPAATTQPTPNKEKVLDVDPAIRQEWKNRVFELSIMLDGYYQYENETKGMNWYHVANTLKLHDIAAIGPRNLNAAIDVLRDHAVSQMRDARKAAQ